MTILRPNHTDILITDLLKGMQFDIDATIQHFKHHIHFFIESVLLRKKDDRYIKEKIIGFTPIQCSCYSLQNDKVNNSIQYLFISDYILEKLDSIKKNRYTNSF